MTAQYSTTHRNNALADITTQAGATAFLFIYTGAVPASCAAAATGTVLASLPMSNPIAPAPAGGVLTMSAITSLAAVASGVSGYWRVCTDNTGATCVAQGTIGQITNLTTNALTPINGNVLNFTSTVGISLGMLITGTGVVPGATVVGVTSTTVTMSYTSTAGVANLAAITFGGDISMNSTTITAPQTVAVNSMTITATGA